MSRYLVSILAYGVAPVLAVTCAGCMLLGYGIGAAIDASGSVDSPPEGYAADFASIEIGDTVDIFRIEGDRTGGNVRVKGPAVLAQKRIVRQVIEFFPQHGSEQFDRLRNNLRRMNIFNGTPR